MPFACARATSRDVHQTGLDKPLTGLQRQSMNEDVDMEARGVPTSLVRELPRACWLC